MGYSTLDDLEQEGKIVLMILLRKRYKPKMGKFSTLLSKCIINKYQKIIRSAYAKKRASITTLDPYQFDIIINQDQLSQLEELERKEIVAKVRNIDEDIADLIEIGVSKEFFIFARNQARKKALKSGTKINKISFAKKIIEKFYGVDLKKLIKTMNNEVS